MEIERIFKSFNVSKVTENQRCPLFKIWISCHSLEFFYFSVIAYAIQIGHFRLKTKSRVCPLSGKIAVVLSTSGASTEPIIRLSENLFYEFKLNRY